MFLAEAQIESRAFNWPKQNRTYRRLLHASINSRLGASWPVSPLPASSARPAGSGLESIKFRASDRLICIRRSPLRLAPLEDVGATINYSPLQRLNCFRISLFRPPNQLDDGRKYSNELACQLGTADPNWRPSAEPSVLSCQFGYFAAATTDIAAAGEALSREDVATLH